MMDLGIQLVLELLYQMHLHDFLDQTFRDHHTLKEENSPPETQTDKHKIY
jgi:hypothetical protein